MTAAHLRSRAMPARCRVGADEVAAAIAASRVMARGIDVEIVRTGSRGLYWLEPLVEVETPERPRRAMARSTPADVDGLFDAGIPAAAASTRCRSADRRRSRSWRSQTRLTFARCGIIDPLSLDDYRAHGGLKGLEQRGRDGAGRDRRGGHASPACAAAAAPASRPASSGRPCSIRQRRPEIHRLQRRRRRQRHLRRPHDHGRRSLRADRRHGDRRHRGRRDQGLRLYPLGISACRRGA